MTVELTLLERLAPLAELKDERCATLVITSGSRVIAAYESMLKAYYTLFIRDTVSDKMVFDINTVFMHRAMREHILQYRHEHLIRGTMIIYATITEDMKVELVPFILEADPKLAALPSQSYEAGVHWVKGTYHRLPEFITALKG